MRLLRLLNALAPRLPGMPWVGQATEPAVWHALCRCLRHDLRGPPTAIMALNGLYWAGALDPDILARQAALHAREALMCIDELACLVDETVYRYRTAATDLVELIAAGVEEAWPIASDAAISLQRMACPGPVWAKADGRMLARLLACLLKRAIALARPSGKVRVGIGAAYAHFCIELTFTPAAQSGAADTLATSTPLGLLARRVMKRHGGAVVLAGEGSMAAWRLVLPRAGAPNKKAPEGAFLPSDP